MGWKTLGAVAAAVIATVATATPALADTPHWVVTALPMPPGLSEGYMEAADGHGGYAGMMFTPDRFTVVTWKDGRATDHGMPAGADFGQVVGESGDGTVLILADADGGAGSKLHTLDSTGFHPVSTGPYSDIRGAVMGPRGDIAVLAVDPTGSQSSTVVLYSSPLGQAGLRPLAGALPDSTPVAIDYDGTVLLGDDTGPYLVRDGAAHRLTAPAGAMYVGATTIRHGVVVGSAAFSDRPGPRALMWTAPERVGTLLDNGGGAWDVNASGRIVGDVLAPNVQNGPAGVWQGTTFLTELPLLPDTRQARARFVDDDGAIAGWSSLGSVGDGGRPVVWRLTSS